MGLDMYLSARKYVSGANYTRDAENNLVKTYTPEFEMLLSTMGLSTDEVRDDVPSAEIEFTVGYWRKVNAVHMWFVNNCADGEDNCKPVRVDREQLVELRDLCREVLLDNGKAEDLLPSASGFFFGSTEYDEWYLQGLEETVEILDKVLGNPRFEFDGWDFSYCASW